MKRIIESSNATYARDVYTYPTYDDDDREKPFVAGKNGWMQWKKAKGKWNWAYIEANELPTEGLINVIVGQSIKDEKGNKDLSLGGKYI